METKKLLEKNIDRNDYYLGSEDQTDYYFYYTKDKTTKLNHDFLSNIKVKNEHYIIYADKCILSESELEKYNITFKKVPRDISKL